MSYHIKIKKSARHELASLPRPDRRRVARAISALADDPRPRGARKIVATDDSYRIHVGDYRIVYEIQEDVLLILIVKIGNRKDIYRKLF